MTLTLLCVDDSSDDTLLLQRACRRAGVKFIVQSVDDGTKAIAYLSGVERYSDRTAYPLPTMVLLDLKMPIKTGFDVLDWLRSQPAYSDLPVAVFTSSQHESDIRAAYRKGANCFLSKPVQYEELLQVVKALDESLAENYSPDPLRSLSVYHPEPAGNSAAQL